MVIPAKASPSTPRAIIAISISEMLRVGGRFEVDHRVFLRSAEAAAAGRTLGHREMDLWLFKRWLRLRTIVLSDRRYPWSLLRALAHW
jgi:hypothetical protein